MLVVTVELWPSGEALEAKVLSRMFIANVGGTVEFGDYKVDVSGFSSAAVKKHARKLNVWSLVDKAIRAVGVRSRPGGKKPS